MLPPRKNRPKAPRDDAPDVSQVAPGQDERARPATAAPRLRRRYGWIVAATPRVTTREPDAASTAAHCP